MSTRKKSTSAAAKLAEISIASPQVIAHRVTRMAMSGPVLSERDRKEFTNMVQEKQVAFAQSFMAMGTEIAKVQQQLFVSWLRNPWTVGQKLPSATERVAAKALEPVRRKAVSNAKRLSHTKLR